MDNTCSVLSVKEFSLNLKNIIEKNFPYVWIKGEIGFIKLHASGHTYFSLKEEDQVVSGVFWRGTPISAVLTEGMMVECYGKITIYPGRSSYQLVAREIKEVSKTGNILLMLEKLKEKLKAEGLFDEDRKKPIPKFPRCIGVITSPTGAVLHDIMHRLNQRFPCVRVVFFPVAVQGDKAKDAIINALDQASAMSDIDTVILARGGGSIEDLACFNDEDIVRKISAFSIPLISAVGHETDTTLVDFVSDKRAPTPTGAAEFATPDKNDLIASITFSYSTMLKQVREKIKFYSQAIGPFEDYKYSFENSIGLFGQKIDSILFTFINSISKICNKNEVELGTLEFPYHIFQKLELSINSLFSNYLQITNFKINSAFQMLEQFDSFLQDKEESMKKYVIPSKDGKSILSVKNALEAKEFDLSFFDGSVSVKVLN
jgi:exodeoxyribonuclease VII large subunit